MNGVLYELKSVNNINTVINNLEDLYSSVYSNNAVRSRRFVIQKYNTGLTKLDTIDSTGSRMVTVRTNMTPDDYMSIKSVKSWNMFIEFPKVIESMWFIGVKNFSL